MTTEQFAYVRHHYGVPACHGRRVVVYGKPGVILADRGHYIGVNFDHEKPGVIRNAHPTSEVTYGEIGTPRKITASQRRYNDYLEVADCFEGFGAYLKYLSAKARA